MRCALGCQKVGDNLRVLFYSATLGSCCIWDTAKFRNVAREWALWYLGGIALPGVGFGMDVHTVKAGINYRFG
jgi:hypothetical protein